MKKLIAILVPILVCFAVGLTASCLQTDSIHNWYPHLNKPTLTPQNSVFPIVWSIIYLCMGISIGLVFLTQSLKKRSLVILFAIQLFLNFAWSILFFYFRNPLLGLIDIILLDVFVVSYAIKSYPVKKISSYLFIPYIVWIFFATYLNAYILIYN